MRTLRSDEPGLCRDCGSQPVANIRIEPVLCLGRLISEYPASRCPRCLEKHRIREKRRRTLHRSMAGRGRRRFTSRSGRSARRAKGARHTHRTILAQGRVLCAEASEARARKLAINKLQKKLVSQWGPSERIGQTDASAYR